MRALYAVVAIAALLVAGVATAAKPQPRIVAATVVGDRVTLTFDAPLARASTGTLNVTVNGRLVTSSRSTAAQRRLQLVLPHAVYGDDVVRVHGRNLRARDGRRVRLFAITAKNRSAPGCTLQLGTGASGVASEGPTDLATFIDAGRFRILSVHADFADATADRGFTRHPMRLEAVEAWIRDLSYGRASVSTTRRDETVRMPKNLADYVLWGSWGARKPFFQDLLLALESRVDFNDFDVVFVAITNGRQHKPIDRVAVAPVGTGIVVDGRELRHFAVFPWPQPELGVPALLSLRASRRSIRATSASGIR